MLTLVSSRGDRDCQGISRRDFLTVGTLGLTGLSLPNLLATRAAAADTSFIKDRAVVMLFLGGGASHIETFNPNMDAPAPYCSVTGEVQTSLPGVSFGGTFPQLARLADHLAVVRSFHHSVGSHGQAIIHVLSGGTNPNGMRDGPGFSMGSMYSRLRGANHPRTGLPTYALLTAPEQDNQYRTEKNRVIAGSKPGSLGPMYAPFDPDGGGAALDNMTLNLPAGRLNDRRALRKSLDTINRGMDHRGVMEAFDRFEQQAVDLVLRGAGKAFDLSSEDPGLVERYDTSMFTVGNKAKRPKLVRRSTLGQQLLMARRLCEAGCGFVTVQSAGWDNHADGNNPNIYDGMEMLGRPLDKAVSAFLEDLQQRGLSDKVLLVITGDFGRTPKINRRGGRDHWANLGTLAFAGGGLNMGQVIGQAGRKNDAPASEPITTSNLLGTIIHTLFDVGQLRVLRGVPANIRRHIETSRPIAELV